MSKEDINLNENGSMSKRKLDKNSINAPGMIDYEKLTSALKNKSQPDQTIWGFVNSQQNRNKEAQTNVGGIPTAITPSAPLSPNPAAEQAIDQTVKAQFPRSMQMLTLLQDTVFKQEIEAAKMQASMTGKPNPTLQTIKNLNRTLGLA